MYYLVGVIFNFTFAMKKLYSPNNCRVSYWLIADVPVVRALRVP